MDCQPSIPEPIKPNLTKPVKPTPIRYIVSPDLGHPIRLLKTWNSLTCAEKSFKRMVPGYENNCFLASLNFKPSVWSKNVARQILACQIVDILEYRKLTKKFYKIAPQVVKIIAFLITPSPHSLV